MKYQLILRNEEFGGVYFNQLSGRMAMIDREGFSTLLKYLKKGHLSDKEKMFSTLFFKPDFPVEVELRIDPTIENQQLYPVPVTKTPVLIDLSLNNYCNLNCDYCYMSAKSINSGEHLSLDDFDNLMNKMIQARVLQIALGGGEPTLHPHFTEILKKLRIRGNIIPNYTTNGKELTEEILYATKKYCGAVAVSYSEEREELIKLAINKFVSRGIQTNLHLVMLKSRIPYLSEIVERYAKLGISHVVLLLFKPMGRGLNLPHEIITIDEYKRISQEFVKILMLRKKYNVRLSIDACSSFIVKDFPFLPESIESCTGALSTAYIDWNLNMKPCSFMQDDTGVSLKDSGIISAWNSPIFQEFRKNLIYPRYSGCECCKHFSSCLGGCPLDPKLVFCKQKEV